MSSRSSWNCSLIDSLSRIRMTASSPCTLGMIDTRKSIVLPRHAQLEAAVLRHALLGDVELRHDLDARDDRAVEALVDRPHRRLQHAVDAVLHVHRVVLRLDVDVARAPLDRACRCVVSTSRMTGLESAVSLSTVSCSSPVLVLAQDLQLEALGRFLEHALRALALLQDRLDRRRRADRHLDRRRRAARRARRSSAGRSDPRRR